MAKDIEVEIFLEGGQKFKAQLRGIKQSTDKAAKGFSKAQASLVTLNQGFQLLGGAVRIAARAISSFARLGAAAIQAGSDFEEANQKFNVIFGGLRQESAATRDQLVRDFGLSRTAATELLASTGDLLTGFGFSQKSALDLSATVNKLAVDLASFSNLQGGAARASEILTKALLGERDALVSLGVKVNESDVQARLLADGNDKLTGSALRQAKAQATLAIILEQAKNAQGDFERSSDSLANQQRILSARLEDLQTQLGQILVPVTKVFVSEILNVVNQMSDWAQSNKNLVASNIVQFTKDLANGLVFVAEAVGFIVKGFNTFLAGISLIKSGFAALGAAGTFALKLVLEAVGTVTTAMIKGFREATTIIELAFLKMVERISDTLINNPIADKLVPDEVIAKAKAGLGSIRQSIQQLATQEITGDNPVSEFLKGSAQTLDQNVVLLEKYRTEQENAAISTFENNKAIDLFSEKLAGLNDRIQQNLSLVKEQADSGSLFQEDSQGGAGDPAVTGEAEKLAAIEQLRLEHDERRKQAISAFNEFLGETEEARLAEVDARRDREIAGLELLASKEEGIAKKKSSLLAKIEAKAAAERVKIKQEETQRQINAATTLFSGLAALSATFGEKSFKLTQGLRIGEAVMNTYAGANKALADPTLPTLASIALATGIIAQGLANVAQITSQKPPTRAQQGLDMVTQAEQPAMLHFGETVLNRQETAELRDMLQLNQIQGTQGGGVNVNLNVENFQLLSEDEGAIGNLTTMIRRSLQEQNVEGF